MPVAVARAASAPSSSIMRRLNIGRLGLEKGKARIDKAGIFALEARLALLGAVVNETLRQKQRLGCFAEGRAQGPGVHQPGFGTIAGGNWRCCSSLRHVTSIVTILGNGHKK